MTYFKLAFHTVTGRRCVEVFDEEDRFVAGIYPSASGMINVVSKYDMRIVEDDSVPHAKSRQITFEVGS